MIIYSASGSGLIKNGSMTRTHKVDFYDTYMVVSEAGGIFSNAKSKELDYSRDQVEFYFIMNGFSSSHLKVESIVEQVEVNIIIDIKEAFDILVKSKVEHIHFIGSVNVIVNTPNEIFFASINYTNNSLSLVYAKGWEKFDVNSITSIERRCENYYVMTTNKGTYYFGVNKESKRILTIIQDKITKYKLFTDKENLIEIKTVQENYLCYKQDGYLKIYTLKQDSPLYKIPIAELKLFLGQSKLILKYDEQHFLCSNSIAEELCVKLSVAPQKLYELPKPNLMFNREIDDLLYWFEQEQLYIFNVATENLLGVYEKDEIKVSASDQTVLVLKDALLKTSKPIDFLEVIQTPELFYSEKMFPMFFKREGQRISLFIPSEILYEDSIQNFYQKPTKQLGEDVKVFDLNGLDIVISHQMYKTLFKEALYEAKLPTVQSIHTEKLLLSRVRNISDLLLFEFFGQWQIILDFVNKQLKKDTFTEEEMTQYGLYLYNATFQQRKRMEELASKYPQFMFALSQQLTVDSKLNEIYQKQQKEMFQLSSQVKSQFLEIENLLSQISYIYLNNEEYQKRLKQAQLDVSTKKAGESVALASELALVTSGTSLLILPVIPLVGESINNKSRNEVEVIQQEKEFKKNEFMFKKSIDLILHMNDYTLNYHIQTLNQLTYKNLLAEAEVLSLNNSEEHKTKLLQQSLDIYTKLSLPINHDTQLKPDKMVQAILTAPEEDNEKTVTLFLD